MEKELKINKIKVEGNDKSIFCENIETINKIELEISFINSFIKNYCNYQKTVIIKVLKEQGIQNIDTFTIFEKLDQIKDEQINFKQQFSNWYNDNCYKNKYDWLLIENFDWILQKANESIENINKQNEDLKQILIDNSKQLYNLINEELEKEYRYEVKNINQSIKRINKITKYFIEYGIVTSEIF